MREQENLKLLDKIQELIAITAVSTSSCLSE